MNENTNYFLQISFLEISKYWTSFLFFEHVGKTGARQSDNPFQQNLEHLEYGINILQKTWNGNWVIWNQDLPTKTFHELKDLSVILFSIIKGT